jgi:hypothetical protein
VFTFVSTDVRETRRVIAACYANGGHLIVPWDVYLKSTPEGSDRYFGKAGEYADLYGFVRDNARWFDRYEDAAAVGPEMSDDRYPAAPLATDGTTRVAAFARARPSDPKAPIVIHLLNTADLPESFTLTWRKLVFFGDRQVRAELHEPGEEREDLTVDSSGPMQSVRIRALKLWAILILRP